MKNNYDFKISLNMDEEKINAPLIRTYKPNKNQKKLIEICNLNKSFKKNKTKIVALDDINLKIYDNENVALLGANGAGKTTLVEIIAGISKQTTGNINYNYSFKNSFQEGIGIQFQDSNYPDVLRVKDIIDFIIKVYEVDISKKELENIVNAFGLKEHYKRMAKSMSGGQQQRLNILLAIIHKPKIIFLDELSTGLDINIRNKIKNFIYQFCKDNNINIILVSHDMEEVELLCDRIIIMQKGKIKIDISKENIINEYGSINKLVSKYV